MFLLTRDRQDRGVNHSWQLAIPLSRLSPTLAIIIASCLPIAATAAEPEQEPLDQFNTAFLQGAQSSVDLQLLLSANSVLPGNYRVDLYSNEVLVGRRDIDFRRNAKNGKVQACLTLDMLQQLGIDMKKLEATGKLDPLDPHACHDLPELIDKATVRYDVSRLRLMVSVPQIAMQRGMRGYVDPALWDQGVSAAFINYQLSSNRNSSDHSTTLSNNLGLRNGINLGGWRLRNESNFSSTTGQPSTFKSNRSFVQHDVTALKGQFSAGDIFSDTDLFDSVRYRGLKLASDEGMRADSERGYAPIIRGVAETSATVEIRQNNYILYTANVPPGPFEISDIYPSGSNGDLEVTIIEADGRRRVTLQAFSSLPIMVREGQAKYSVSAGKYNSNSEGLTSPQFVSSTLAYGISSNLTGIVGVQASDNFQALALGAGRNTRIGAVSIDLTHSASRTPGQSTQGNSLRALYAKTFTGTDTSFTLAAYRYSTEGYRTLTQHVEELGTDSSRRSANSKTRTDLTVNQSLGRQQQFGSVYLNASDQRYWNRGGSQSLSAGYSNVWGEMTYNVGATYTKDVGDFGPSNNDTLVNLSLSFPLGSRPRAPRAFVSASTQKDSDSTQVGINGYLSEDSDTYYSLQGGNSSNGGNSASANLSTRTSVANVSAGYSQGRGYTSQNLNLAGAVVAHGGGINLGQTVGETFALAEVPGVAGVKIGSYSGAETGRNGFAVVPNAQPYRVNWISLDTRDLGADIEIDNATRQVVPRRGAVVLARYASTSGRRVQFELFDARHKPLPFGAALEDRAGKQIAISDPGGKALALVEEDAATLLIKWNGQQCTAAYSLPERDKSVNYERVSLVCQP
ncbi:fimbrial biogenesis outer membrane usher protein [Pseudomonas sp. FW215-R2]|jgi:outer membrane usher protein|uniref:fimbria/pilus outer membrane usher protein n=1 Tax=unclassified Pseudomonas TaxID=196821 RepID=UPI000BD1B72D|nr:MULTISPECIES: fimbria/pilus outer membrane usher protein [unclassified Pseudomonas]PCR95771.1 fimbrial protein [Pseudomonas fluorescens]PMW96232.1 fimbrial biogenesis outer membrane usher protein [Pseudomonas sp. FW215-R2]PMX06387.1 fimbrial biogenesis outer membrane usher protein [Pseudomonas sp. FW215-L1]PMX19558.1 fimbrial biogenesis outer membrane usher protein [Pseudomonas sp. FW215-E1]PNA25234.1 fimbrial biogenesis outer membrane usher protein [Pseudomonas sp. FW215-R4]